MDEPAASQRRVLIVQVGLHIAPIVRIRRPRDRGPSTSPVTTLFHWLGPLVLAPSLIRALKIVTFSDRLEFDRGTGMFLRDREEVTRLDDIEALQIREYRDSDGDSCYRLSLVLCDGSKHFIDRCDLVADLVRAGMFDAALGCAKVDLDDP